MSEISQEDLNNIAASTDGLVSLVNESVKWVNSYLEGQTSEKLAYSLKQQRRKLNKVKTAVVQKPTIALFGASQVGKSYLVKNILSDNKNQLLLPDSNPEKPVNFIQEINPVGDGGESTSLVTRFSYNPSPDAELPPVKIRFLSASDLLLILFDSYYSDFKKRKSSSEFTKADVEALLATLPNFFSQTTQNSLTEDDVYDIEEYLLSQFKSIYRSRFDALQDANYWNVIAKSIGRIAPDAWVHIFAILWGNLDEFSGLFSLLIKELQKIEFEKELYCNFDAVRRSGDNPKVRTAGAILDIKTLSEVFNGFNYKVTLTGKNKKAHSIDAALLCAISAEVVFHISEDSANNNEFIKKTDILDFPGARARYELDENTPLTERQLTEMFLRGKVSYLFNSYSLRYEINNLFICNHSKQIDVRKLPEIINNWIEYNLGTDAEERKISLQQFPVPPLFIVFTWWNMQLQYDQDNDKDGNYDHKWEHRFKTLLEKDVLDIYTWRKNWTTNGEFNNFYLLRDYKYSKDVFDGFEANGYETQIVPGRVDYYDKLKKSFISSNLVKGLFTNPDEVWENTSIPGYDGSKYIIKNIARINSNQIRTNRYLHIIRDAQKQVKSLLIKHFHSGDKDKEIMISMREASEIHAVMNKIFGEDAYQFGNFIEHFTLLEKDIFEYYYDKLREMEMVKAPALKAYQLYREGSPDLSSDKTFDENIAILMRDYKRESVEETIKYFEDTLQIDLDQLFFGHLHDLKNSSQVLAEGARDFWFQKKLNKANFQFIIDLGLDEALLDKLFDHLKTGFGKNNIAGIVAENIRTYTDTLSRVDLAQDMIAHITAGIINEFATSCGWSFYAEEEKNKIRETNKALALNINVPDDEAIFNAISRFDNGTAGEMDLENFIECMANMNEHLNKIPMDIEIVKLIPMVKNYRLWREKMKICFIANNEMPTYNPEANNQLGSIITRISSANF